VRLRSTDSNTDSGTNLMRADGLSCISRKDARNGLVIGKLRPYRGTPRLTVTEEARCRPPRRINPRDATTEAAA
jgi:hypothetical protein